MKKLASGLLLSLILACGVFVPQAAIASDRCASREEFRAVHRGMPIHRVQNIFDTHGRIAYRDGSELVKVYVRCGGTHRMGPWADITYDRGQMVRKIWEVPGAD
jgi:hypothetical protein